METLVLSSAYEPVARISWQRAMVLLFGGKVEVLEEYEDREVRSVTYNVKMPSVIRFVRALRKRGKGVKFSRENVYARDSGKCQYCGKKIPRHEGTYDHVIPRAQGGKTTWENIVIACVPCNQKKGGRNPSEAKMKLISTPVKPKKLPETVRFTFLWEKHMPENWKNWVSDYSYWNTELEQDL